MTLLLADREASDGPESWAEHRARFGDLPPDGSHLIAALEHSELRGRGGAGFPVGAKWRTVAQQPGRAVVLVNGAEGEPLSCKDRALMSARPHLVLDGAFLAAQSVGADRVVLYVGERWTAARDALERALQEREQPLHTTFLAAPHCYVAGEETAAVHAANGGVALPTSIPPRPYLRGVDGRPTLVQNVESLAQAALIARRRPARTVLLTVSGHGGPPTPVEAPYGAPLREAVSAVGGSLQSTGAVLLGGYFGTWVGADEAAALPLDSVALRLRNRSLGAGIIALLPQGQCGVVVTATIADYLAGESAQQCGPCVFGLRAIAEALHRVARCTAEPHDVIRLRTWATEVTGRGACRHPDGAAALVLSALNAFDAEFQQHLHRSCTHGDQRTGISTWPWGGAL